MRVGMVCISNEPSVLFEMGKSLENLGSFKNDLVTVVIYQHPIREGHKSLDYFDIAIEAESSKGKCREEIPFARYRYLGFEAVQDCDYFWMVDCDYKFRDGAFKSAISSITAEDYFNSLFEFMEENKDIGVLTHLGYLGGTHWHFDIKKNPANQLMMNSNGGMVYRNIGLDKVFPEEESFLFGPFLESLLAFNIISNGYGFAKRLNCPTRFRASRGEVGGFPPGVDLGKKGELINHIRHKFNDKNWDYQKKRFPKGLMK